jgi:hypothetical protein
MELRLSLSDSRNEKAGCRHYCEVSGKKQAKKIVKKRFKKGRSSPDYNPAKVDFNPEIKPLLPPKMTREEISEMVKLVDAKSKTKTGVPGGLTPLEILKKFKKTGASKKTKSSSRHG